MSAPVVIIPGIGGPPSMLEHWHGLLPAKVSIHAIPGLGGPAIDRYDLASIVRYFAGVIPPDALVVGESFGGLIGLGLANLGRRVIAFDPPLTMAKQFRVQQGLRKMLQMGGGANEALLEMFGAIFGLTRTGTIEERIYYPLIESLPRSVDIVTGDVSHWSNVPLACVLDDVDRYFLSKQPNVRLHILSGHHLLLRNHVDECRKLLLSWLSETD